MEVGTPLVPVTIIEPVLAHKSQLRVVALTSEQVVVGRLRGVAARAVPVLKSSALMRSAANASSEPGERRNLRSIR
jgi:hypothetical protein